VKIRSSFGLDQRTSDTQCQALTPEDSYGIEGVDISACFGCQIRGGVCDSFENVKLIEVG